MATRGSESALTRVQISRLWFGSQSAAQAPKSLLQVLFRSVFVSYLLFPLSDAITEKPLDLTFSSARRMCSPALCRTLSMLIHLRDVYIPLPWPSEPPHKPSRADIAHPPCGPLAFSPFSRRFLTSQPLLSARVALALESPVRRLLATPTGCRASSIRASLPSTQTPPVIRSSETSKTSAQSVTV